MPNRYIRESAIESESVNALSWQAEVFYRRLLNRADDFGRFTANAALLRASLFPLQLGKVSEKDIAKLLKETEECGLLAVYEVEGKKFLALSKWEQGRAKESRHPSPPESILLRLQTYVYKRKHPSADVPDSDSDSDTDSDKRPAWVVDFGIEIPESLRTENCIAAIKTWLQYKKEKQQSYKPTGLQAMLTKWSNEFTSAELPQIIDSSMAQGYAGAFRPNANTAKQTQKPTPFAELNWKDAI